MHRFIRARLARLPPMPSKTSKSRNLSQSAVYFTVVRATQHHAHGEQPRLKARIT
jgi:hypothetical protein